MSLQPGTRLGNYEVLSELGSGGMGEVYKARDLKLGREVAIKVLPQEMAADSQRLRRFEQEARAASALNHPNIVTIYEIGEHEGTPYIAMEYVEGKTLREILAGGPLPNDKLIRYATQMAEGLAKAHQAGIVHRDLKPENIIISEDGYVKILDFGLAKLMPLHVDSETKTMDRVMTTEGVIVGTVQYMSPEQAAGRSVDFRSDQFALASILYEMATGKRPFERETAAETLAAIIREEPDAVTVSNPAVSAAAARVIDRCLSKEPKDRYDSTGDIAKDIHWEELGTPQQPSTRHPLAAVGAVGLLAVVLVMIFGLFVSDIREWVAGEADAPRIESIAVLPLVNLSGDPEQEYFADGMTDALIADLAKIEALKVISRTSAMRYKGTDKPLPEIARELNVDGVVEGTVLREGDRVRITVQLIEAATDQHLWTESYERGLTNVLALQGEVARAIAREIEIAVTPEEEARLATRRAVDPEAHDLYLKGLYVYDKAPGGLERANQYFQQALVRDPSYAPAYARLASSLIHMGHTNLRPPIEVLPEARAAAMKAQELDETLAETRIALASIKRTYERDWHGVEREFELAIQLNPSHSRARVLYAWHLSLFGRHDAAVAQAEQGRSLDPVSISANREFGRVLYWARRYDEAITQFRATIDLHPTDALTHVYLMWAYFQKGMYKEALAQFQEYLTVGGANPEIVASVGRAFELGGIKGALQWILEFQRAQSKRRRVSPGDVALVHALLGEKDQAFEWLEKAYREYDNWMFQIHDPVWDSLRPDPRFQDLLRRLNLPT